jgi:hypothetical protein
MGSSQLTTCDLFKDHATLVSRLFRDRVQFCSGLVDLVAGVGHHLGGGHRFTLAGERFVGPVAEDFAKVGGGSAKFRVRRCGERTGGESGAGGRRAKLPRSRCPATALLGRRRAGRRGPGAPPRTQWPHKPRSLKRTLANRYHQLLSLFPCLAGSRKHTHLSQHGCHVHIGLLAQESVLVELENC